MFAEFRFVARSLIRWRGGAIVAVLTLSVGIGATTALYALVRVMLPDLPGVPDVGRLARVYASSPSLGIERSPVALNDFDASLSKASSFSAIGPYASEDATVGTVPDDRIVTVGYASPGFFRAMGVPPVEGRLFTDSDVNSDAPVAIVSQAFWRTQFPNGRLTNAVVRVDGTDRAVVAVMPAEFAYSFVGIGAELWIPLGHASAKVPSTVSVYARLRPGATWQTAGAELTALSKGRGPWMWRAIPIDGDTGRRALTAYAFVLGPALLVLLITCVNVACLLMARGIARDQELSVRRALGATRGRIVRLLLLENAVLALVSGSLGVGLAIVLLRVLDSALGRLPGMAGRIHADASLLPIALTSSAVACLLFGTLPALSAAKRDVAASLNGVPPRFRIHIAGYGARDLIVFAEIGTSVGLIVWTAMAFTLLGELRGMRLMLPADRIVAISVPDTDLATIISRVAAIPGVIRASSALTGLGGGLPVQAQADDGRTVRLSRIPVGEGFFDTVGTRIVRGRAFDPTEAQAASGVAIGVVADSIDYGGLARAGLMPGDMYVPFRPSGTDAMVVVRTAADPHALLKAIADAARTPLAVRPPRAVIASEEFERNGPTGNRALGATVLFRIVGGFALVSLLLAGSGIFAVVSQSVAQRTREFGIRLAIGATPRAVLALVLGRETRLIGVGVGCGVVFTLGLTRVFFVQLTTLAAQMPALLTGALLFSGLVAATAVAFATWRIVRLEPAAVLRRP
jgi:putative ABC transport system permease protein